MHSILQHDLNFVKPEKTDSWSEYPNEAFFIRKFEKDIKATGRQMRIEESKIFRQRLSPPEPCAYNHGFGDLKPCIRNYIRLCRGEKLVGIHWSQKILAPLLNKYYQNEIILNADRIPLKCCSTLE